MTTTETTKHPKGLYLLFFTDMWERFSYYGMRGLLILYLTKSYLEGGLAIDGSLDRTCFAFHKDAIGYGEGIAPKTEINYIPEKTSFLVASMLSAGATVIDAEGIVSIVARES